MPVVVSVLLLCMALMWSFWASLLPAQGVQGAGAADMRWLYSVNYPPLVVDRMAAQVAVLGALVLVIFTVTMRAPRIGPFMARHPWWRALVFLILVGGFTGLEEVALRHAMGGNRPQWRPDPELHWVGNPGASTHNTRGLNSPEIESSPAPGTARIMVIGDSATWGSGVPFHASYPRVLEHIASQQRGCEVVNAAMPGYSSTQSLRFLRRIYGFYHPTVLLIGFNNDGTFIDRYSDAQMIAPAPVLRLQQALYASEFYLLVRRLVLNVFVSRVAEAEQAQVEQKWAPRVSVDEHVENYRAFIRFAREHGMKVAVMIMPSEHRPGYDEADRRLCQEEKVPCIEFADLFKGTEHSRALLLPDGIHPTVEGHALMARFLYQKLKSLDYL